MSAAKAASMQSIMLLALAATKFLCGILSDSFGAKAVNVLCLVCNIVALVLLAFSHNEWIALTAVLVFSVGLVMTTITVPLLSSALFGYHPQSNIIGIFMALIPAASVVTLPLVNSIYDRIGTYSPIFLAFSGVGLFALVIMFVLFWISDRDRKRYESVHPELIDMEESV
jgi:MFS family permease